MTTAIPKTHIQRLLKEAVEEGIGFSTDAKMAFTHAIKTFIEYITVCAQEITYSKGKKTISPEAINETLQKLDFAEFVPLIQQSLEHYKEQKNSKAANRKAKKSADNIVANPKDEAH
ncbi:hypothetical protein PCE1_000712 [Barthelona sp. PCE]